MPDKDARIGEHHSNYRRGLVLGLTMAEIMILILFTLLLALASAIAIKEQQISESAKKISELGAFRDKFVAALRANPEGVNVDDVMQRIDRQNSQIVQLEQALAQAERGQRQGQAIEDIIREIERQSGSKPNQAEIAARIRDAHMLAKANEELRQTVRAVSEQLADAKTKAEAGEMIDNIIAEIERQTGKPADAQAIAGLIQDAGSLAKENETLRRQTRQLSADIRRSGRGNEFPSCWLTEENQIESIFNVTFASDGVLVSHRDLPNRAENVEALPLVSLQTDTSLTLSEFRSQLRPLYQWSVAKECRFYVVRFSKEQSVRADLVNAVNSYFYPDSSIQVISDR